MMVKYYVFDDDDNDHDHDDDDRYEYLTNPFMFVCLLMLSFHTTSCFLFCYHHTYYCSLSFSNATTVHVVRNNHDEWKANMNYVVV